FSSWIMKVLTAVGAIKSLKISLEIIELAENNVQAVWSLTCKPMPPGLHSLFVQAANTSLRHLEEIMLDLEAEKAGADVTSKMEQLTVQPTPIIPPAPTLGSTPVLIQAEDKEEESEFTIPSPT